MGGPSYVIWRGRRFNQRTIAMVEAAEAILGRKLTITQGSFNSTVSASAGTHDGGGVFDAGVIDEDTVIALRAVGFAAWHRRPSQGPWPHHTHAVAIGDPSLSRSAANQVTAYKNGRNGLANNGPDDGPDVPYTTWEQYQASQQLPDTGRDEDDDMTPEQAKQLDELHGRLFRTGYVDMHMSAIDDVILGTKYADYVPSPDGTHKPLTVVGALFSARRDAYYARVDAAVARRLAEEQAKGVTLTDQGIAEIVEQVKAELPDALADELSDRLGKDQG